MKITSLTVAAIVAGIMSVGLASCDSNSKTATANSTELNAPAGKDGAEIAATINIRYIDGDSIARRYQGSIDYEAEHMKTMQRLDNAQQAKAAEIQKFGAQIEQKARTNGYLTQETYAADMQRLQKMQQDAESYLANLARKAEVELAQRQVALNDTIEAYIKRYNANHGYDAILFKNAGIYFNPALDITDEVIEGLNASYAKPAEAK
ncbi:MAG: OmpH family outer membrane protein [Duncaniella sp.]|nr:OmpH family outer membrane protein [Duncaniella sp.]